MLLASLDYSPYEEKASHTVKPRSKRRSERAHERKDPLTWWVLGYNLDFFLVPRFTTQISRPPQGTGPLPATGEACSSVTARDE
jgi:hypothetical protein